MAPPPLGVLEIALADAAERAPKVVKRSPADRDTDIRSRPGILPQAKSWVTWFFCGDSPSGAVENWMEAGATKGAITGAVSGAGIFGAPTFGIGGVPGAVLGGFVGSVVGTGSGAIGGGIAAAACYGAGVYGR
jgi:hypothetical protein